MTRRAVAALALAAVLGAGCSGDRNPAPPGASMARPGATPTPRCDVLPGKAPEGFVLVGTKEVPTPTHVGEHRTYRAPGGARLDVLLGAEGEVGEGLRHARDLELASGRPARLLTDTEVSALVWEDVPPCVRNAILGRGLSRRAFLDILRGMGIVGG